MNRFHEILNNISEAVKKTYQEKLGIKKSQADVESPEMELMEYKQDFLYVLHFSNLL